VVRLHPGDDPMNSFENVVAEDWIAHGEINALVDCIGGQGDGVIVDECGYSWRAS